MSALGDLTERMADLARRCDGRPDRYADEADALHADAYAALVAPHAGRVDPLPAELRDLDADELLARVGDATPSESYREVTAAGEDLCERLDAWRAAVREGRGGAAQMAVANVQAARAVFLLRLQAAEARGDLGPEREHRGAPAAEAAPALVVTDEPHVRGVGAHRYAVVLVRGERAKLPEAQLEALRVERRRLKAGRGPAPHKDALSKARAWLKAHDLTTDLDALDARGL